MMPIISEYILIYGFTSNHLKFRKNKRYVKVDKTVVCKHDLGQLEVKIRCLK